jgi:6-phosphogluconolactonase
MMKKLLITAAFLISLSTAFAQNNFNLLIGTYTSGGKSEGIYTYNFNADNAESNLKSITKNVNNPSYLTLSPDKNFVYSVNETGNTSTISAFKYNKAKGELDFLNKVNSEGNDPCYIISDNKNIVVANYSGGTLASFARENDGKISNATQIIKHTGKSIDPKGRQNSAHVHMVKFSRDKKFIISTDLGEDNIYSYNYNPTSAKENLTFKSRIETKKGSGPRHFEFSKNGKYIYLLHEFDGIVTTYKYNSGILKEIDNVPTIEPDFNGKIDGADIHLSDDGKFLYSTNRGDANTISVFSIQKNGKPKFIERVSTLGKGPRNFTIDPTGKYLLVAHQYTHDVVIFNRDKNTGKLTDSNKRINVGAPVCLVFDK